MSVLDLRGPEFLELYVGLLAAAGLGGLAWRWACSGPFSARPPGTPPPGVFDTAYLAGGSKGLADAVLASLVHRGLARLKAGNAVSIDATAAGELHPVERETILAARHWRAPVPMPLNRFRALIDGKDVGRAMESAGFAVTPGRRLLATAVPALSMAALLALGIAKVYVGLSHNRPVGFLLLLCLATGFAALGFCYPLRRSVRGGRVLADLRQANAALHATARRSTATLTSLDVALALSLWGPAMLTGNDFARLRDALAPAASSGGGSSCGSGSSCGGGGCGGGGCGGCGGG